MSVTSVRTDPDHLTMTVTAEYPSAIDRVWRLCEDPRLLERWWGPPTFPATVEDHDLRPGGRVTYVMTGPDGERYRGWWRILSVDPPRLLEFEDGFADADGTPSTEMPVTLARVELAAMEGGGTRMTLTSTFPSREAMDLLMEMQMEEGMRQAVGQTGALLEPGTR